MTFDPKKPVQTRDGRKVRIVCTDAKASDQYPILALVEEQSGYECTVLYSESGRYRASKSDEHPLDLVNVPEATYRWMNVYKGNQIGAACQSREEADKVARSYHRNRVSIVQIKMVDDRVTDAIIHDM